MCRSLNIRKSFLILSLLTLTIIINPAGSRAHWTFLPQYEGMYPTLQILLDQSEYIFIGKIISKEPTDMGVNTSSPPNPKVFWLIKVHVTKQIKGEINAGEVQVRSIISKDGKFCTIYDCSADILQREWEQDREILFFVNELKLAYEKHYSADDGTVPVFYTYIGEKFGVLTLDSERGKLFHKALIDRIKTGELAAYKTWGRKRMDLLINELSLTDPVIATNAYLELMFWPAAADFASEKHFKIIRKKWKSSEFGGLTWRIYLRLLGFIGDHKSRAEIQKIADESTGAIRLTAIYALYYLGVNGTPESWVEDLQDPECSYADEWDRFEWARSESTKTLIKYFVLEKIKPPVCKTSRIEPFSTDMTIMEGGVLDPYWLSGPTLDDAPLLASVLELDNSRYTAGYLELLAPLKYEPAVPLYRKIMNESDNDLVVAKAALALSPFMSAEEKLKIAMPLAESLKPPPAGSSLGFRNISLLGALDVPETAPILIKLYGDIQGSDVYHFHLPIVEALQGNPHPDVRPFFWRVLEEDHYNGCRTDAIEGIALDLKAEDYDRLVELLPGEQPGTQQAIIEALAKLGDKRALPLFRSIYPEPIRELEPPDNKSEEIENKRLRKTILAALRKMKDPDAVPIYQKALEDYLFWYKYEAIMGLVQLNTPQAKEVLTRYARRVNTYYYWTMMKDSVN